MCHNQNGSSHRYLKLCAVIPVCGVVGLVVSLSGCGMEGISKGAGFSAIREGKEEEGGEVPEEMGKKSLLLSANILLTYVCSLACWSVV